jgi:hypothetical protein
MLTYNSERKLDTEEFRKALAIYEQTSQRAKKSDNGYPVENETSSLDSRVLSFATDDLSGLVGFEIGGGKQRSYRIGGQGPKMFQRPITVLLSFGLCTKRGLK